MFYVSSVVHFKRWLISSFFCFGRLPLVVKALPFIMSLWGVIINRLRRKTLAQGNDQKLNANPAVTPRKVDFISSIEEPPLFGVPESYVLNPKHCGIGIYENKMIHI